MTRAGICAGLALLCGAASPLPAVPTAAPAAPIVVRAGEHPGFGRIAFDLPAGGRADVATRPPQVVVRVAGARFAVPPRPPRNAAGVTTAADELRVTLLPDVQPRLLNFPGKLVIDLPDPHARVRAETGDKAAAAATTPRVQARLLPARLDHAPPPPHAAETAAALPATDHPPAPTPASHEPPAAEPVAPAASPAASPEATHEAPAVPAVVAEQTLPPPAAVLPIPAKAGVAALRRGNVALLVADAETPSDPEAWTALPGLEAATVLALPGATLVTVPMPTGARLVLDHTKFGWTVVIAAQTAAEGPPAEPPPAAHPTAEHAEPLAGHAEPSASSEPDTGDIPVTVERGRLLLTARAASRVVSVADPLGGGTLLVGTQKADIKKTGGQDTGPSPPQHIAAGRRLPMLAILPTWIGVAIEPLADTLDMTPLATGFAITLGTQAVTLGAEPEDSAAAARAAGDSRRFDFPSLSVPALAVRLQAATGAVAAAPPRGRAAAQLRLAQAMIALGLGAEAQAVLQLASAADGRIASNTDAVALGAIAALVAGRLEESGGLADPPVAAEPEGAGEIALWRALRELALAGGGAAAAPPPSPAVLRALLAHKTILFAYPEPLRRRFVPPMIEAVAAADPRAAAGLIEAAGELPGLDFLRAELEARDGKTDAALARLDRLAAGQDRRERARAAVRAVELRRAAGKLTPVQAADSLDALVAAWRGDDSELALRLKVAEARVAAGQPRAALAMLREAADEGLARTWSEPHRAELARRLAATFRQALEDDAKVPLPPLDFLTMIQDNADLMPAGEGGETLGHRIADRLAALDLPERAEAALHKLVEGAPPGPARGAMGARLAALQVQRGDHGAALLTLSASTAETLPPGLVAERTMIFARASAARGELGAATGALAALDTPEADALRAKLLEEAGKWSDAAAALQRQLARSLPADGPVAQDAAALAVHLASVAAQTGQDATLEQLRRDVLPRLSPGREADTLRMLTEGPVRSIADLPRAAQETEVARLVVK